MLRQVAEGVSVHPSELLRNNAVVVEGPSPPLPAKSRVSVEQPTANADAERRSTGGTAARRIAPNIHGLAAAFSGAPSGKPGSAGVASVRKWC